MRYFFYPVGSPSTVFSGLLIQLLEVMLEISVSKVLGRPCIEANFILNLPFLVRF